jgi:adenosine deaminase
MEGNYGHRRTAGNLENVDPQYSNAALPSQTAGAVALFWENSSSPQAGRMKRARIALALLATITLCAAAQTKTLTTGEVRATRGFEAAKKMGPGELYAFLQPMPKGADLHMHLSGAIYAETFLAEAIKQRMCVDPVALKLIAASPIPGKDSPCVAPGTLPVADVLKTYQTVAKGYTGQQLYDALVDAFSMRNFVPTSGFSGHDQFFSTFDRFGGLKEFSGEWLDEVAARAATQNEQYLEIMQTPPFSNAATLGYQIGWPTGAGHEITRKQLSTLRDDLLRAGLKNEVAVDSKALAEAKSKRAEIEHCDGASAEMRAPACRIRIHWLYQVLRAFPPQQVFAQTLLGFEVASADSDVVGINFVQPEDDRIAMRDYHLQMEMLDYLHSEYPKVRISLHAGELAPGLVPPAGMSFHIREAVELGHAERIGHGVDVLYETNAPGLLKELAAKHVMVEINLTSNEGILGVKGAAHPLAAYRSAHVPVALSTDDEGVSRIDLTHEYVKASEEQGLSYVELKTMVRTSLEHAFLAGVSLWAAPDDFGRRKPVCGRPITVLVAPSAACTAFLNASERAAQQWELERRFAVFEEGQK